MAPAAVRPFAARAYSPPREWVNERMSPRVTLMEHLTPLSVILMGPPREIWGNPAPRRTDGLVVVFGNSTDVADAINI